jgi:hypothetical protein
MAVVIISIVALLIASPFFLQIQKAYGGEDGFWTGYQNGKDDRLDRYGYNDYCSPARNDDLYCAAYKIGYKAGWEAAGVIYGAR